MNDPATSLDRLHDLVIPPLVPWWPLATGWYILMGLALILLLVLARHTWKSWKANAYRRAALRQLTQAQDAIAIGELLRRTALAIAPRQVIAEKTANAWTDWLSEQCPEAMPDTVRTQLTTGVYRGLTTDSDFDALRKYATLWIKSHHRQAILDHSSSC